MSDGSISQDEIDALLAGVDMGGIGAPSSSSLNENQKKALQDFAGSNTAGFKSNLETMTGKGAEFGAPSIELINRDAMLRKMPEMVVSCVVDFNAGLAGDHIFVLAPEFAQKIVSLVNNEANVELDEMALSVISETLSQQVGIEITALDKAGLKSVTNSPAESVHVPKALVRFPQQDFVLFTYPVTLDDSAFSLWEIIPASVASEMANAFGAAPVPPAQPGMMGAANNQMAGGNMGFSGGMQGMNQMNGMNQMQGMPMGGMNMQPNMGMGGMPQGQIIGMNPNVQPVQFPNLQVNNMSTEQGNIGLIMDVYMEMTVELGRTRKVIKDILGMGEGTIIELDKLAGEPVDILVNHKPIAKGEVVVIDENFGVRVTEILSPMERVTEM